jgi:hypothetical protein
MTVRLGDRLLLTNAPETPAGRGRPYTHPSRVFGRDVIGNPLRLILCNSPDHRAAVYRELSAAGRLAVQDQAILETLARYGFLELYAIRAERDAV